MNDDVVRLTRKQLRKRNQALKPLGLKICGSCQGKAQPVENFYRDGVNRWKSICIRCYAARDRASHKRRYAVPQVRASIQARCQKWYWANRQHVQEKRRRRKLRRVLGVIRKAGYRVAQETIEA